METSDSDYFESADEDFVSDEEDITSVKASTKEKEDIDYSAAQLNNLKLASNKDRTSSDKDSSDVSEKDTNYEEKKLAKEAEVTTNIGATEEINKNIEIKQIKKTNVKLDTIPTEVIYDKPSEDNIVIDDKEEVNKNIKNQQIKESNVKSDKSVKIALKKIESQPQNTIVDSNENKGTSDNEVKIVTELTPPVNNTNSNAVSTKPRKVSLEKVITPSSETNEDPFEENLWGDDEIEWGTQTETNEWDNDDWEPVEAPIQPPQPKPFPTNPTPNSNSWGAWGNWGVSSILTTATQGVSSITHGLSTALESGMGVPDPEQLARINKADKEKLKEPAPNQSQDQESENNIFGLGNFAMGVSHLTKFVEATSTKVISGGLDTLETIGKKTMEVLQEGDPGLKRKRAFLKIDQDKPILSQLLKEAKQKAENENKLLEQKHFAKKAKNYETLFDDHQGLVHLEALEMLSRQCDIKLQNLLESYSDDALTDMQETMEQVKELCELPDEEDDELTNVDEIKEKLETAISEINVPISYKRLLETWEETEAWLNTLKLEICDEREIHQQAIETLAQLTAIAVEQFHKSGELLLVKEHRSTADEADSLVQLTTTLTTLIGVVAAKFSDKLNAHSKTKDINSLITNVFFEAANSSSYIQDAFQLLIPVLQVGAI